MIQRGCEIFESKWWHSGASGGFNASMNCVSQLLQLQPLSVLVNGPHGGTRL